MRKRRSESEILGLLKELDRDLAKGLPVGDCCRKLGVSVNTYYAWRKRFSPAEADDARRLREMEKEIERLKRLVAELMLDKQILEDISKKKW